MDFKSAIPRIEKTIGYTFKDKSLLMQAFTRSSFCNEQRKARIPYQSNEVLEFFGDGVLSVAIISFLMRESASRYEHGISTELCEGDFSNIKARLSDKKNLSCRMASLGLNEYLLLGEGDVKLGIKDEPSVMEDLFESIIGAIYIDCDMNIATVMHSVEIMLDISEYLRPDTLKTSSAKNLVQEWCASKQHRHSQPEYRTLEEIGPDHKKSYTRACVIDGRIYATGVGKNLKAADNLAAQAALTRLMAEDGKGSAASNGGVARDTKKQTVKVTNLTDNGISVQTDAVQKLREYARAKGKFSPTYRDLGEIKSNSAVEYCIECSFMNIKQRGVAATKAEAKLVAASLVLKKLKASK